MVTQWWCVVQCWVVAASLWYLAGADAGDANSEWCGSRNWSFLFYARGRTCAWVCSPLNSQRCQMIKWNDPVSGKVFSPRFLLLGFVGAFLRGLIGRVRVCSFRLYTCVFVCLSMEKEIHLVFPFSLSIFVFLMFIFVFYVVVLCLLLVLVVIHLWWLKLTSLFSRRWLCWHCRRLCRTPPLRSPFNRKQVIDKQMCATVAKSFSSGYYIQLDFVHYVDFTHAKCSLSLSLALLLSLYMYLYLSSPFIEPKVHSSICLYQNINMYIVSYNWKLILKPRSCAHAWTESELDR